MADTTEKLKKLTRLAREKPEDVDNLGGNVLSWLNSVGNIVSPWWSKARDADLRRFWKLNDHLASAIFTFSSKMEAIPFHVESRDMSIRSYVREADQFTDMLLYGSQLGSGWLSLYDPFLQDLLCQDNGGFIEVLGEGEPDGPIVGPSLGLIHRDSYNCQRTGNPIFPVVYTDKLGKRYKLHFTRVIFVSQMPSPDVYMNQVGFCACSRAINTAQHLIDLATYEQEKLGSRPHRQLLIGQHIDATALKNAFVMAEQEMSNQGLSRFAKTVAIGSKTQAIDVKQIDLASVPDGFSKSEEITLGMFAIALALGTDARELWPGSQPGATRADAMVQAMKARGKGSGWILSTMTSQINSKVLPPYLKITFELQDDDEDAAQADIRIKRSETRNTDVLAGVINVRVAREQALRDGDIDAAQFSALELADGRLDDGNDVLSLYYSEDEEISAMLNTDGSDASVKAKMEEAIGLLQNSRNPAKRKMAREVLAALKRRYGVHEPIESAAEREAREIEEAQALLPPVDNQPSDMPSTQEVKPVPLDGTVATKAVAESKIAQVDVDRAISKWNRNLPSWRGMLGRR